MLISHKYKFIFVHIYKTAGTSVTNVFLPHARLIDRLVYDHPVVKPIVRKIVTLMNWHDDGLKQFTGFHKHAKAYEFRDKLGRKTYASYFKFTFVRNPFDFLVSLYFYNLQNEEHPQHDAISKMSFAEYLAKLIASKPPRQTDFVTDPESGEVIVDYIGRFETIEKDVRNIQNAVGINQKRGIPHHNPSTKRTRKTYTEYYDKKTRKLVETYFGDDLANFGYSFNGYEENMPIIKRSDQA